MMTTAFNVFSWHGMLQVRGPYTTVEMHCVLTLGCHSINYVILSRRVWGLVLTPIWQASAGETSLKHEQVTRRCDCLPA
jgi:hypothetical protein